MRRRRRAWLVLAAGALPAASAQACSAGPKSGTDGFAAYGGCSALSSGQTCVPVCATGYTVQGSFVLLCDAAQQYDASGATCIANPCTLGPSQGATAGADYSSCNVLRTGGSCTPACPAGSVATGPIDLVCVAQQYDASASACTAATCSGGPQPGTADPRAGYSACSVLQSGASCTPQCPAGFAASGSFVLVCVATQYDASSATCVAGPCSGGPVSGTEDPLASYAGCSGLVSGQTCTPACPTGYAPSTSFTLQCSGGKYSASAAACNPNPCTAGPRAPAAGVDYTDCSARWTGQQCSPVCPAGFALTRVLTLLCDAAGTYDASGSTCSSGACAGGPSANADAFADYGACSLRRSGESCTPQCASGFTTQGSFTLVCSGGRYDAAGATCDPGACSGGPLNPDLLAGYSACNSMVSGQSCVPSCPRGYTAAGALPLACVSLQYDASGARCRGDPCDLGPYANADPNANYSACLGLVSGQTCAPQCATGYTLGGLFGLVCVGRRFDAAGAACSANSCALGPTGGTADPRAEYTACGGLVSGQRCLPSCPGGYAASGDFLLACVGQRYDASGAICAPNACSAGPSGGTDPNAIYTQCSALSTGAVCTPQCAAGWTPSGAITMFCTAGRTYDASGASCRANACSAGPSVNADAVAIYSACSLALTGQRCVPACPAGHTSYGSFVLVCTAAGYDAKGAVCVPDPCGGGPSVNADPNADYSSCSSLRTGDLCTPACGTGYRTDGRFSLLCLGGQYDALGAYCAPVQCTAGPGTARDPAASYAACNVLSTGDVCIPTCATGYTVVGNFTLLCSGSPYVALGASCAANSCTGGVLNDVRMDVDADYSKCNALTTGQICLPTCRTGFVAVGQFALVCVGGRFSSVGQVCSDCTGGPSSNEDPRATYSVCNAKKSGQTCSSSEVNCTLGYTASGVIPMSCTASRYSAAGLTCAANPCTSGPSAGADPVAAYSACSSLVSGQWCTPQCAPGYTANGSFPLTCTGLQYEAGGAVCDPNPCTGGPVNPDPRGNYSNCTGGVTGGPCAVECADGYSGPQAFAPLCESGKYDAAAAGCSSLGCTSGPIPGTQDPLADYAQCSGLASGRECAPLCPAGYEAVGSILLVCTAGRYNASGARCVPSNCSMGPRSGADPLGSYAQCNALLTGANCTPQCPAGWTPVGSFRLLCTSLRYDAAGASCSVNSCAGGPRANVDPRANYTACNALVSGQQCTPNCTDGWLPSGALSMVCSGTQYDAAGVVCSAGECALGPRANAQPYAVYSACNALRSGDLCAPRCVPGYSTVGAFRLACAARRYDAAGATCRANTCAPGPEPGTADPRADYSACSALFTGRTCTPSCALGWTPNASLSLNCTPTYDASASRCSPDVCTGGPRGGSHGAAFYAGCNRLRSGDNCTPSCIDGFTVVGSFQLVCNATLYDASGAVCVPTPCSAGPFAGAVPGANYAACSARSSGQLCEPACPPGFLPTANFTLVCWPHGYNASGANCTSEPCTGGPVAPQAGADYSACTSSVSGQVCRPRCATGFTLVGSFVLSCRGGTYSTLGATCAPNSSLPCLNGPTTAAPNADYSACNALYTGQSCTVGCASGYSAAAGAPFTLICLDGQYRDLSGVQCAPNSCGAGPRTGADGNASYGTCRGLVSGQTCAPTCNAGFTAAGSIRLACDALGTFDARGGFCYANACSAGPGANAAPLADYSACTAGLSGATCTPRCARGYSVKGSFLLVCTTSGYDAAGATCSPNSCRRGPGANVDGNAQYAACLLGFSGQVCDITCTVGQPQGSISLVCEDESFDAAGAYCAVSCSGSACPPAGQCFTTECTAGTCAQRAKPDGARCTDSDARTVDDQCVSGACRGTDKCRGVSCVAPSQCHSPGVCDPSTGQCSNPVAADGTQCDDGNAATVGDVCTAGACSGRERCESVTCTPVDSCHTSGLCDQATGLCSSPRLPDGFPCDDAVAASAGDSCRDGVCSGVVTCGGAACPRAGRCTLVTCNGATCVVTSRADGTACTDENPLTVNDQCLGGDCVGEQRCAGVVCSPVSQCHLAGECLPTTGSCTSPQAPPGTRCDDGNPATVSDVCTAGTCAGSARCAGVTCPATQCLLAGECDTGTGSCTRAPTADGTTCDDGEPSTTGDMCIAGACMGSVACGGASCSSSQPCFRPACSGSSCLQLIRADGSPCDDASSATTSDQCALGVCVGSSMCSGGGCAPPGPCHEARCDAATGSCSTPMKPDQTPCDDGNAATTADQCAQGVCRGTALCSGRSCPASDACHAPGLCDPLTGLCTDPVRPDGTWCDDGAPSTVADACVSGVCRGSVTCGAASCAAEGQCQTAACSGSSCVQLAKVDGTKCNDGDPSTVGDQCVGGTCVGRDPCASVVCTAADQCHLAGTCAAGVCSNPAQPDGSPCDDFDPSTGGDQCTAGACRGSDVCAGVVCPPSSGCHYAGACDPTTGLCEARPREDGTACDDGSAASTGDVCSAGVCLGRVPCGNSSCTAATQCLTAVCAAGARCEQTNKPDGTVCNDVNARTSGERCLGGVCTAGTDLCAGVVCVTFSQCHTQGVCEPRTGRCSTPAKPDYTACDDGDPRTAGDRCIRGVCKGEGKCAASVCPASDDCHYAGYCAALTGRCSDEAKPDGTVCNDGNAATVSDRCAAGHCRGSVTCGGASCASAGRCYTAACDGSVCRQLVRADGSSCNDEKVSTVGDVCAAGECVGRDPCAGVVCSARSQCHDQGACDASNGVCTNPPKPDGTACDDGVPTTHRDRCSAGVCAGAERCLGTTCTPRSPCHTAGTCQPESGLCTEPPKPDGAPCSDGDDDTFADRCISAVCAGTLVCSPTTTCQRVSACQRVACDGGACRTLQAPPGTPCVDGDSTTAGDRCLAGVCRGVGLCTAVTCPASGQCYQQSRCDPATGECVAPAVGDGAPCSDGMQQTVDDVCVQGSCVGTDLCSGITCPASDSCHLPGACDSATGLCSDPRRPDGWGCDDGDGGTVGDACRSGTCVGLVRCAQATCVAASPKCMVAFCAADGRCAEAVRADGTQCNDETAVTMEDACGAGACAGVDKCGIAGCPPLNQCREAGRCDPRTGGCTSPFRQDGTACSDGSADTVDDRCVSGQCVGALRRCAANFSAAACPTGALRSDAAQVTCPLGVCSAVTCCEDPGACGGVQCPVRQCMLPGRCAPATGLCSESAVADGTLCDDSYPSTTGDRCAGGACAGSVRCGTVLCTPPDPQCRVAQCSAAGACSSAPKPDGALCSDGNPRTVRDRCLAGVCTGADLCVGVVCPASDQCHSPGVCSPATGFCTDPPRANGAVCDDGDPNTVQDTCRAGVCVGFVPCGNESCMPRTPQCIAARCAANQCAELPRPDGQACNDNNASTAGDLCVGGVCVGAAKCAGVFCPAVGQCSTAGRCAPSTGECVYSNRADGTACDDFNPNTTADACRQGVCTGTPRCAAVTCPLPTPQQPCIVQGRCDPTTGLCSEPLRPDGFPCDDADAATLNDSCRAGRCVGTVSCSGAPCPPPSAQCTAVVCAAAACVEVTRPDGSLCSDGDPQTVSDSCAAGACRGASRCLGVGCEPASQCHEAECEPATGRCAQRARPNGTTCDDFSPTTTRDRCYAGVCRGEPAVCSAVCPPPGACEEQSVCDPATQRCTPRPRPDGLPCDDRDNTTAGDVCIAGSCVGQGLCAGVICFPLSQCHAGGVCSPLTGRCSQPLRPGGWACDDSDPATAADACTLGRCVGTGRCLSASGEICASPPPCRAAPGTCDAATGLCFHPPVPDGAACGPLGAGSICLGGECVSTAACAGGVQCRARGQCYEAACQNSSCVELAKRDSEPCDDADAATVGDACFGGRCRGRSACVQRRCPASDDCHAPGACDPATGQCSSPLLADGTRCSVSGEGGRCVGGACRLNCTAFAAAQCPTLPLAAAVPCAAAGCARSECCVADRCANVSCPPRGPCDAAARCNPLTGECAARPLPDGAPCWAASTASNGTCSAGDCLPPAVVCGAVRCPAVMSPCLYAACEQGACTTRRHYDGTRCDDLDPRTRDDRCRGGTCRGVDPCRGVVCPPATAPCTVAGTCDSLTGLCSEPSAPDGAPCDDDDPSTAGDACAAGVCSGALGCAGAACARPAAQCAVARCEASSCVMRNATDGALCSDGDPATAGDRCMGGRCVGARRCDGVVCVPRDQCHAAGVCDPATGMCTSPPATEGLPCSDGDNYTADDRCRAGRCVGAINCGGTLCLPSEVQCAVVQCAPDGVTCLEVPRFDGALCDDMDEGTAGDRCASGRCVGELPRCGLRGARCAAPRGGDGQCSRTEGRCEASGECVPLPLPQPGAACRDGDALSTQDRCTAGACSSTATCGGAPCRPVGDLRCNTARCIAAAAGGGGLCRSAPLPDGTRCPLPLGEGACTSGTCLPAPGTCAAVRCPPPGACQQPPRCHPATGLCLEPDAAEEGTPCDDGDNRTVSDRCLGGTCVGVLPCGTRPCAASEPRCRRPVCLAESTCGEELLANGTACGRGRACIAGLCMPRRSLCSGVVCPATDQCHAAGACDPDTGLCTDPALPDGTPCDDWDPGTLEDVCRRGVCAGSAVCGATVCTVADPRCTVPRCNYTLQGLAVCSVAWRTDGASCNDGRPNTFGDVCMAGRCVGQDRCPNGTCPPPPPCRLPGSCTARTGRCFYAAQADGTPCTDVYPGEAGGVCRAGACVTSVLCGAAVCLPRGPCFVAFCRNSSCTQMQKVDGTACDDGNEATTQDRCQSGQCAGRSPCAEVDCPPQPAAGQCLLPSRCNPHTGSCESPRSPDGTPCDDGLNHTTGDRCIAGACSGYARCGAAACVSPDAQCQVAACAAQLCVGSSCSGTRCGGRPLPDGTPCAASEASAAWAECRAGKCVGVSRCAGVRCDLAPPLRCRSSAVCNPLSGLCAQPPAPDGALCSDNAPGTAGDVCLGGGCAGSVRCGNATCLPSEGQCRTVTCEGGACVDRLRPDGAACDDGLPETAADRCSGGACSGRARCEGVTCPPASDCLLAGRCLNASGLCEQRRRADGTECDGGLCRGGLCIASPPARCASFCPAAGPCQVLRCVNGTACAAAARPDGTLCTGSGAAALPSRCLFGSCIAPRDPCLALACPPLSQCHLAGECIPGTGVCTTPAREEGAPCDDGDPTTVGDRCYAGRCRGGALCGRWGGLLCVPEQPQCMTSRCVPPETDGVCDNRIAQPDGLSCDDGDWETLNDSCVAGTCRGNNLCARVACPAAPPCSAGGRCDPRSGLCTGLAPDGTPCDDGRDATNLDVCMGGVCVGDVVCGSERCNVTQCAGARCNDTTGRCVAEAAVDGTACDDGDNATARDVCINATCVGAARCRGVVCASQGPCRDPGTCDPATGLCSAPMRPEGAGCLYPHDGDWDCGAGRGCRAGAVQPGSCSAGSCVPTITCIPGAAPCSLPLPECRRPACASNGTCIAVPRVDGAACVGGRCLAGVCLPSGAVPPPTPPPTSVGGAPAECVAACSRQSQTCVGAAGEPWRCKCPAPLEGSFAGAPALCREGAAASADGIALAAGPATTLTAPAVAAFLDVPAERVAVAGRTVTLAPPHAATTPRLGGCVAGRAAAANPPPGVPDGLVRREWLYAEAGGRGPGNWSELRGSDGERLYPACSGPRQSPIDLPELSSVPAGGAAGECPGVTAQSSCRARLSWAAHDGAAFSVGLSQECGSNFGASDASLQGKAFDLRSVAFRSPAEHLVAGQRAALEVQLWHRALAAQTENAAERLAVALRFELGPANPWLDALWPRLLRNPLSADGFAAAYADPAFAFNVTVSSAADPGVPSPYSMLPQGGSVWAYDGSDTRPPCHERVRWVVYGTTLTLSQAQLDRFRDRMGFAAERERARAAGCTAAGCADGGAEQFGNARPPQQLRGRAVRQAAAPALTAQGCVLCLSTAAPSRAAAPAAELRGLLAAAAANCSAGGSGALCSSVGVTGIDFEATTSCGALAAPAACPGKSGCRWDGAACLLRAAATGTPESPPGPTAQPAPAATADTSDDSGVPVWVFVLPFLVFVFLAAALAWWKRKKKPAALPKDSPKSPASGPSARKSPPPAAELPEVERASPDNVGKQVRATPSVDPDTGYPLKHQWGGDNAPPLPLQGAPPRSAEEALLAPRLQGVDAPLDHGSGRGRWLSAQQLPMTMSPAAHGGHPGPLLRSGERRDPYADLVATLSTPAAAATPPSAGSPGRRRVAGSSYWLEPEAADRPPEPTPPPRGRHSPDGALAAEPPFSSRGPGPFTHGLV